ncbi:MAG: hypothetical protein EOP88_18300 [Verrucomicrobiaceae bacterium]|nr:MAG: hypothetical protein EOP88_18300 [Verrucomicrobiaceae bacterium]
MLLVIGGCGFSATALNNPAMKQHLTNNHQRMIASSVRRAAAVLLLVCFGLMLPSVAGPIRSCILENDVHAAGFTSYGKTPTGKDKCCPDCGSTEDGDSCCVEVKKLPDAEASVPAFSPALLLFEIPAMLGMPSRPMVELPTPASPSTPIRGPDAPGAFRARLSIWNI